MRGRMVIHSGLCVSDHTLDKKTAATYSVFIDRFYIFLSFQLYFIYFNFRCAPVASLDSAL